jgi:hypothetical protein
MRRNHAKTDLFARATARSSGGRAHNSKPAATRSKFPVKLRVLPGSVLKKGIKREKSLAKLLWVKPFKE